METLVKEEDIEICEKCHRDKKKNEGYDWFCSHCGEDYKFINAVKQTITRILLKD